MNMTRNERRCLQAMGDVCNDSISESEGRWLSEQIRTVPATRDLYVDYMSMHACLSAEAAALRPAFTEAQLSQSMPEHNGVTLAAIAQSPLSQRSARLFGKSWLMVAATVVFVALFTSVSGYVVWKQDRRIAENLNGVNPASPIARITATQNCRWDDSDADIGYGSELRAGHTIRLREGLVEITFTDGATMLLESPATVVFQAADQIEMREGRMAAMVPPGANSLCVHTQTLELCNADAEFGLLARETGSSELHVFNGTVNAEFLNPAGERRRSMEVRASEAVLTSLSSTTVFEFPANETHFVRSMSSMPGPHDGLLAYEGFVYPAGPLSAQNGGFGWAGPWSTIAADSKTGPDSNSVSARSLATLGVVPRGNHAAIVAQQNRIRRSLASSVGGVFDVAGLVENRNGVRLIGQDGTTVYLSFLQRVDKLDDGFYGLELHRGDGNANRVLCVGNGADNTKYGVTSAVNVYGAKNFPALGEENTEINLFVLKITFGANDRDTVEVFRNPISLKDEQLCSTNAFLNGNFAFDRISLANFDGSKTHEVDEIRVGTHFLAVTGRWRDERGRLLRRLTDAKPLAGEIAGLGLKKAGNSRNFTLFAAIAR